MNVNNYLKPEEIRILNEQNDWKGLWLVLKIWGGIALIFAMIAIYPNVFTILLPLVLFGEADKSK